MTRPAFDQQHLATPVLVCSFLCAGLFGNSTTQTILYFRSFKKDPLWLKLLLLAIWTLDAAHTTLIFHSLHYIFIRNFNNPSVFQSFPSTPLSFDIAFLMGAISMALTIAFHSYRMKLVTSSVFIRYMCFLVSGTRNALLLTLAALSCSALLKRVAQSGGQDFPAEWMGTLTLACIALSAFGDANGTLLLSCTLWRHRKEKLDSTKSLVTKIILYTVRSGACRTVFMFTLLIWMIVAPINVPWVILVILGPRVYSASLLTTLNTRLNLRASNMMDSIGENLDYLDEIGSMKFDGSATRTEFDHGCFDKEGDYQADSQQNVESGAWTREGEKPCRPTLSISGSTPPVSPVVDLRDSRPFHHFQHPYETPLPDDEPPREHQRIPSNPRDNMSLSSRIPLPTPAEIAFTRQARYFIFGNLNSNPHFSSCSPSGPQQWTERALGKTYLLKDEQSGQIHVAFVPDPSSHDDKEGLSYAFKYPITPWLLHPTPSCTSSWAWKVPCSLGGMSHHDEYVALRFEAEEDAHAFREALWTSP